MFVARRGCPKEERRGCSSSAVCSGPRGCAGSVFCVFDAAAGSAPLPQQINLAPGQRKKNPNPTGITPASCLEGPTLSTYICSIAEARLRPRI